MVEALNQANTMSATTPPVSQPAIADGESSEVRPASLAQDHQASTIAATAAAARRPKGTRAAPTRGLPAARTVGGPTLLPPEVPAGDGRADDRGGGGGPLRAPRLASSMGSNRTKPRPRAGRAHTGSHLVQSQPRSPKG